MNLYASMKVNYESMEQGNDEEECLPQYNIKNNFQIDGSDFNSVVGQISDADLSPELQSLPNILMIEVDNVQHEQFTVTEEVKVPNS